jgi:hypothetical protein
VRPNFYPGGGGGFFMGGSIMEQFTITNDGARDIRFTGEKLAEVSTSPNNASPDYSGAVGQWTELRLYRTEAGKFVCERIGRTQWQGQSDSHEAAICEDEQAVAEFFGCDRLAKDLYAAAGIDVAEEVA